MGVVAEDMRSFYLSTEETHDHSKFRRRIKKAVCKPKAAFFANVEISFVIYSDHLMSVHLLT